MWSADWNVWGYDQERSSVYVSMIPEIISMPIHRLPHNFRVDSGVFKHDESKTEAKTNSGYRVCTLSQ